MTDKEFAEAALNARLHIDEKEIKPLLKSIKQIISFLDSLEEMDRQAAFKDILQDKKDPAPLNPKNFITGTEAGCQFRSDLALVDQDLADELLQNAGPLSDSRLISIPRVL